MTRHTDSTDLAFLLARPDRTVRALGARERFADAGAAVAALRAGRTPMIVGALPFDPHRPAALAAPDRVQVSSEPWQPGNLTTLPSVHLTQEMPSRTAHVDRVTRLVKMITAGELDKVVAARSVLLTADDPIDPEALVAALVRRHPSASGYAVDLTGAGDDRAGATLVGSSPELLVGRHGSELTLRPLAGTAPRRSDPTADRAEADALLASVKNREEHSYVIDWIRERLTDVCSELDIPAAPELISTREVWHLATPIRAVLRDASVTALDIAVRLHPTPAVCGTPTDTALATITAVEEDRGFYGGAVGWCDEHGDGDWIVAIRCAEISPDRRSARAYAGGGIVAASDPHSELEETTTKLGTLLGALGVPV